MSNLEYSEIVCALPIGNRNKYPLKSPCQLDNFQYVENDISGFVAPTLSRSMDNDKPQIIIVSASGAVGKSTLAQKLAFDKKAPLWDLSLVSSIAKHSLSGAFRDSFEISVAAEFNKAITSGNAFVIIDALDEARIKATEAGFHGFIEAIANEARSNPYTSFVLFGRTQICETIWLLLEESSVSTGLLSIMPFNESQSYEYVELKINNLCKERSINLPAVNSPQFVAARDLIFNCLKSAISGERQENESDEIREVLGYAPVLDSISVMLALETNYYRMCEQFNKSQENAQMTHIELLLDVVENILTREQERKLTTNIRPALEAEAEQTNWNNWINLYTPTEQALRLISLLHDIPLLNIADANSVLSDMPQRLRSGYEAQLKPWLPEHPFLKDGKKPANTVFESYLYASALCKARLAQCYTPIRNYLQSSKYKSSRLLSEFYLSYMNMMKQNELPSEHIGIIYESMLSAESHEHAISLTIDGNEPEDERPAGEKLFIEGEIKLQHRPIISAERSENRNIIENNDGVRLLTSFTSEVTNKVVQFGNRLRRARIIVPCAVQLGNDASGFELGPDVFLKCKSLNMINNSITVIGGDVSNALYEDEGDVTLEAVEFEAHCNVEPIVHGKFQVCWNGSDSYPWNRYSAKAKSSNIADSPLFSEAYRRFRRIVLTLESHRRSSLAKLKDKVESNRVLQNELGVKLLKQLNEDGILVLEDIRYHWVPDKARELVGISWQQLRKGETSDLLEGYLRKFINTVI